MIHLASLTSLWQLFNQQFTITEVNLYLQKHIHILEQLGPQGMSSDESDHEEATRDRMLGTCSPRYLVSLPRWRAESLSNWLHVFDSAYISDRRVNGASRGDFPHLWAHNAQDLHFSNHPFKAVLGLLKNTYDSAWILSQRNFTYEKDDYAFIHDNGIFLWSNMKALYAPSLWTDYMPALVFVNFYYFHSLTHLNISPITSSYITRLHPWKSTTMFLNWSIQMLLGIYIMSSWTHWNISGFYCKCGSNSNEN